MLSLQDQEKLNRIMEILIDQPQEEWKSNKDVSDRLRDKEGRCLPNPSKYKEDWSLRSIRVVKMKGSYGTYLIKNRDSYERLIGVICLLGAIVALTIIF